MKKLRLGIGLLAALAVGLLYTPTAHGATVLLNDMFNGPTLSSHWHVDRALPQSTTITTVGGQSALQMGVTPAGHQADSFYDYQGYQRSLGPSLGPDDWNATAQIYVSAAMLSGLANAGFWLRTGNGADESTADYDIVAFRNPTGSAGGFYTWDDVGGNWLDSGVAVTTPGWYDVGMAYNGSAIVYSVAGNVVRTDTGFANPAYVNDPTTAFVEMYNYGGDSYTVAFDNVLVTSTVPEQSSSLGLMAMALPGLVFMRRFSRS